MNHIHLSEEDLRDIHREVLKSISIKYEFHTVYLTKQNTNNKKQKQNKMVQK